MPNLVNHFPLCFAVGIYLSFDAFSSHVFPTGLELDAASDEDDENVAALLLLFPELMVLMMMDVERPTSDPANEGHDTKPDPT